ncbi:uncharacterized protein BDZ99DRAFT_462557 [Mytilinidion resinicola]|uniref:Uncharacterized protein n=1 Tax=Mytilinidion resinicola TaxID=574789 RepID=A0A6A6YPH1_9PEZI|nr:uncharacterized protein BDZ99DRAFT_462557 [Mytilinidion resinicola]KAF2809914.1 hypothetical protein BDZ99DRAFT_462557 [Mytilinidion resinicola]
MPASGHPTHQPILRWVSLCPPARGILQSVILTGHSQPHAPTAYILFTRLPSLSTNQAARSQLNFLTQGLVESRIELKTQPSEVVDGSETLPREV